MVDSDGKKRTRPISDITKMKYFSSNRQLGRQARYVMEG